MNLKRLQVSGI
ncbi:hypothetical protein F383_36136 [Gossypium arboreum]|uniref:Uncharacterized protein n=1 Tax=Gossypium arboreum TaxID=29729 RepID=A0A0B0N7X2_GOSAR|nr:hypothetical protein F383_36136 [Gossypium arboreum]